MFAWLLAIGSLCVAAPTLSAASYYVATSGSNTNSGSQQSPWLTIAYAGTRATPGDVVRVQAGTYNERVTINTSGTSNAWINYVADGHVTCQGFDIYGISYVRLIGFEITHTNTTYRCGVVLNGTCAHIDFIDNYIHEVNGNGFHMSTVTPSYITYRGNTLYYMGLVPGVSTNFGNTAIEMGPVTAHHMLAEYNTIQRSADVFIVMFGTNNIARNNYCWDFKNIYWSSNSDNSIHSDIFQDGSDGMRVGSRHHLYERNFCGDCVELNSHFGIWQDTMGAGDTNMLIRGNIAYNFGSGGVGVVSTKHVCTYNNTFWNLNLANGGGCALIWWSPTGNTDYSTKNLAANTIVCSNALALGYISPFVITPGNSATLTHNLGYASGSDPSYVSTSDPLFADPVKHNFRLLAGSPAIGTGTNVIWIASTNGSGTTFKVNDAQLLCDGWGMVDGDTITIGGTTTVITNINWGTSTVGVRDSVAWTTGMAVYWGMSSAVDIGALPYGSRVLTEAKISQNGSTCTVTPTGDARGVWFYVDGIPTTWVSTPPFTATITNGTVTAKAYALYAQPNPVVLATSVPSPPSGLRVVTTSP